MDINYLIDKKRLRKPLKKDEIQYFITEYMNENISDAQAGVILNYIYEDGMSINEIADFAVAMAETGKIIDLGTMADKVVDKHSTGGVGDKVTLILIPVLAALDIPVAKLSSRGMGVAFGTIEKLEAIPGYVTEIPISDFKDNLGKVGVGILSQTKNLNPAENRIYKLRNEIHCVDAIPLIAASLISLKLSTGANKLAFEINYGKGTYIKNKTDAIQLAGILKRVGAKLGKKVVCMICSMEEPLGHSIGNNLEMIEAIEALKGKMTEDLGNAVVTMASAILKIATGSKNQKANEEKVKEVLRDGTALKKFVEMIKAQQGDVSYIKDTNLFDKADYIVPIKSTKNGFVKGIDSDIIGNVARYLGAGRMHKERLIDDCAGIVLNKKIGDEVKENDILAYVHTNEKEKAKPSVKKISDAFEIVGRPIKVLENQVKLV